MRRIFLAHLYFVIFIAVIVAIAGSETPVMSQCEITLSAAASPEYHNLTLTLAGPVSGTTIVQIQDGNGQWIDYFYTIGRGDFSVGPFPHNSTQNFRTHNGGGCPANWVYATATTRDVGQPWLYLYTGFTNGIMVDSGPVPPDLNTAVYHSTTGEGSFDQLGVWQTDHQEFVQISPNQTHYFYAKIYLGIEERQTPIKMVRFAADQDYGNPSCQTSVGKPVNVTNGNMFLSQTDYKLPGIGETIDITRSYNSFDQSVGIFGLGWSSPYDESITLIDSKNIRLLTPDGRATYFARPTTAVPFTGITPGFLGDIAVNTDGTYTLTFKDGRTHNFLADGRMKWQKDRNGNETTLYYTGNVLTSIKDASLRTISFEWTTNRLEISDSTGIIATYDFMPGTSILQAVTYPDGSKYKFEYDTTSAQGRTLLKTVRNALNDNNINIVETHTFDNQGRATTSEINGAQEKYMLDYSDPSFTNVTDGLGRVTKYYFDRSGVRTVVKKIEGMCSCGGSGTETTEFLYDDQLNLTKKTDALGHPTGYTYDSDRNVTSVEDVLGTQVFSYNPFGEVLTATDRMGGVSTNTYDTAGNLLTSSDALNNVTTFAYPTNGNKGLPESIKDARNNVTKFTWYAGSGLLKEVEDPYTKKTGFTYDDRARIKTVTNALMHVTQFNYVDYYIDPDDMPPHSRVEMIYPNSDKIIYRYDQRRLRDKKTDERGKVTVYHYDPNRRLDKITDPLGHFKQFAYDTMSNLQYYTDPLGNITSYVYDDFNRVKEIDYPAPTAGATVLNEKFGYDHLGRIKKVTDTAGRATDYTYDDATRVNTVTRHNLAGDEVTTTTYNKRFQTVEVKDALLQVYGFTYDPNGRMLSQTRAGGTMTMSYDAAGNPQARTDYMGRVTSYTHDKLNRLTNIDYGSPAQQASVTYGYDDISRLTSATNEAGTVTLGYDIRNRLTSTTDVFGQSLVYEYERTPTVNQKRLVLNGALYATYNFDNAERLENIVNASDGATIGYTYYNDDAVQTRTYPNGVSTNYLYDNMRRLTRLTDSGPSGTLFDRQYSYNSASQISQIVEPTQTRMFGYDNVDQLLTVTNSGGQNESYLFDKVGNRTSSHRSSTYGYEPTQFNRLASTQTASYRFDANGSTVSKSEGKNFWRYVWDYENKLVSASTRKQKVVYRYDALGRRVQRHLVGGKEITKYTYEGNDVLMDSDSGTLTKYLNGPGIDNKLRMQTGGAVSYFLADHLGSTNGLTNSSGAGTATNAYDSFGNPTNATFPSRYQFTGREFDNFSGLQFSRARFYDPNLGRFLSEDPIGFEGGDMNLFGYVRNNPINFADPTGLIDPIVYQDPKIYPDDPAQIQRTLKCYKKNKFSSTFSFGNPTAEQVIEYVEVGSLSSLSLDAAAGAAKAGTNLSENRYASGINMVGRHVNRALGYPKIGGYYPYRYFRMFGDKATPVLAVTGALTFSYNVTTDVQCLCGIID